jgi:hypothetical protein
MDADWENFVRLIHLRFGQESEDQQCQQLSDFMANCEQVQKGEEEKSEDGATELVGEIVEAILERFSVPAEVENQEEFKIEELKELGRRTLN